jgi:hypothetical protein
MRRTGLALTAAIIFSLTPVEAPVVAAPLSPAPGVASEPYTNGLLQKVWHRPWHRPHCHRDVRRHGTRYWHRHVGPYCRTRVVRRHRGEDCIRIGGVRICF